MHINSVAHKNVLYLYASIAQHLYIYVWLNIEFIIIIIINY